MKLNRNRSKIRGCFLLLAFFGLALSSGQLTLAAETQYAGTAKYLDSLMDARTVAMGGASVALPGNATSVNYNPAALAGMNGGELASSYAKKYDLLQEGTVALRLGSLAVAALYNGVDGIEEKDTLGNKTGQFDYSAMAIMGGYGIQLGSLSVGAQGTYARDTIGSVQGQGFTGSAGVQLAFGNLRLGAVGHRLFGDMTYGEESQKFTPRYAIGAALVGKRMSLTCEYETEPGQSELLRTGAELSVGSMKLRGGGRYDLAAQEWSLSTGAGISFRGAQVDYAYVIPANLPVTHRLSIGLTF